ncbi:F5/8 type C domain-containing protein [Draconibacterium orientale]|uniref:Carbohydrate-binding protein n=1 Tax=Draconibacterium orientale TaxID=1168034 RepID=X5DHK9_9BACT|nr:family 43 glycosylhydrolase [Draconibacterium orientale]AHW60579.1 carbohydrate-binding protein [Draconibacterium orientale]SET03900.1 F5/8 type C domain-containing protein [Draconibacterium orientale]
MVKNSVFLIFLIIAFVACKQEPESKIIQDIKTICNPLDLSYRFQLDEPSRREAADPTVVLFQDEYYLFASKSGGYWYSSDLADWTFVKTDEIPTEQYAPTALVINDTMYFMASSNSIFKATDLKGGKWKLAAELPFGVTDPALFLDDDQRLYFYWGCSDKEPIYGVELDYRNNFQPVGDRVELMHADTKNHGWEVPGDYNNLLDNAPWIEGAWMNKHNGKYYLQYAGPGTQFKSYSDGVYTSDHPLGPFTLAVNNPFACHPEGFATGAGHGSTFEDKYGNFWHIGTVTISQKHMFERRLALYPAFFDEQGELYSDTRFGDYPMTVLSEKVKSKDEIFPGWMLLSYNKPVSVLTEVDSCPKENITDEDIRTYWSAQSGSNQWAVIDLETESDVYAVQINFAEHNTNVYDRQPHFRYRYSVDVSSDNKNWQTIIDRSDNETDNSHPYIQLKSKVSCRYMRITNYEIPAGNFALSGFRVFGLGNGDKPASVSNLKVERPSENRRVVNLSWEKTPGAVGYQIRYGVTENKLYQSYKVYNDTAVTINSLNANRIYFFAIEAFNENGVTETSSIIKVD